MLSCKAFASEECFVINEVEPGKPCTFMETLASEVYVSGLWSCRAGQFGLKIKSLTLNLIGELKKQHILKVINFQHTYKQL